MDNNNVNLIRWRFALVEKFREDRGSLKKKTTSNVVMRITKTECRKSRYVSNYIYGSFFSCDAQSASFPGNG